MVYPHKIKQKKTKLASIWQAMKQRCYNKNCKYYKYYGLRNITVCEEWKNSFQEFARWMVSQGYHDSVERNTTFMLDRIDNDGQYCPKNCRLVDNTKQQRNKQYN